MMSNFAKILLTSTFFSFVSIVHADDRTAHQTLVSENAAIFTPGTIDGRVEAIAIDGDTVYVGGTFTQIQMALDGEMFNQPYLFAYSKSTGAIIRQFDPVLDDAVRALQTTGEGTGIFAGGEFTTVNGEINKGLVKLNNFGNRVQSFSANVDKRVYTLDRSDTTLYIGGNFERVGQLDVENLAAVDTVTGELLPNINLDFDGAFSSDDTRGFQSVDTLEVTSDDQLMLVVGNFKSINGLSRSRIALIELDDPARVSDWNTNVFDGLCPVGRFPQYIFGIDIAPDDSYIVTGTSGGARQGDPACQSILRFELDDLNNSDMQPTWRTFTGGDSVYEVAATDHAVYTGGHFRWLNNAYGADFAGPGAIERRGLAALDPLNGLPLVDWRSDRNPRGIGVFALEVQPEGLYIGDDTDFLNGAFHPKLKFLAITEDKIIRPATPSLPTSILSTNTSALETTQYNGTTLGAPVSISSTDWSDSRGAMSLGNQLFHADDNGDMWVSTLLGDGSLAPRSQVDLRGLTSNEWELSQLGGMFFSHEQGRVYYSLQGDPNLYWRAFTPDGQIFGDNEFIADNQGDIPWQNVRGMDVIGDKLYFGRPSGNLFRATISGARVIPGTTVLVSGPGLDGRLWGDPLLAFSSAAGGPPAENNAQFEFEFTGSASVDSFRIFEFPVDPEQPVDVRVSWDDPNAQLNVFLRDANDQLVDSDNRLSDSAVKWLSAPAGTGGIYKVAVKIKEGSTTYTVSAFTTETPAEPSTDFEFSSNGSAVNNSWQVFKFDVEEGDTVNAKLIWDNPNAEVNVFLRNETNTSVDSDTDGGGSPATVSSVAQRAGRWSVGVKIKSGSVNYDVLVDTVEGTPLPTPVVTNIGLIGTASQSSTANGRTAARAIDGNTNGMLNNSSITQTNNSNQPWWEVRLSEVSTVENIIVHNLTDSCCASRLSNFTVSFRDDNGETVFSKVINSTPDPARFINLGSVTGRTLRIQLNGSDVLSLAEIQVMGYGNSELAQ